MMISASLSINIEFYQAGQHAAYTCPILPITKPLLAYWQVKTQVKARLQRAVAKVRTAAAVASIGLSVCKFALGM